MAIPMFLESIIRRQIINHNQCTQCHLKPKLHYHKEWSWRLLSNPNRQALQMIIIQYIRVSWKPIGTLFSPHVESTMRHLVGAWSETIPIPLDSNTSSSSLRQWWPHHSQDSSNHGSREHRNKILLIIMLNSSSNTAGALLLAHQIFLVHRK